MPRKTPPHVERNHVKGKTYYSFRMGKGPRIRLPDDPRSEEFAQAYRDALAGNYRPASKSQTVQPGSIAAIIRSYRKSAEYIGLRATTKQGYESRLRIIEAAHGHRQMAGLNRERIVKGIMQPYADRPGQALAILKMLRVLIRHAMLINVLKSDPSIGIRRPKGGEIRSWTDEEIAQFEAYWPVDSKQRLAFALHLYTGQRRSDVHRMTWADIQGNSIRVVQQKTGAKLTIPMHRNLVGVLAAAGRQHVTILNTAYGKPFTVDGFSGFMRDAITEAGLPLECQAHGLRKAAGRRLAEAGCTAHEIMSVLGHKTLAEAERYTREADQARMAMAAVTKLQARSGNGIAQTDAAKFGETAEKGN
ncbi:integrase [Microvirga vignae]|uniref:Integrase n=1 Tax=Microvirga vignae TaxID=1225564 RepID=A0A0H1R691_9HYPH|nr:tyrosine-type recombinase/integrase [Microvirga vignae]KLK90291.1 integrase [Microvirga vignae]